ncbi:unnamed protein product [Thlaspi arvense]|uniref:Protein DETOXIFICATION n=1 Tax=Thlaspi arvense TaxID=13288 RepID=A0AAU9SGC3_THLAR|nr:unnamed protein product [Thlaspi arvense]
MGEEGRMQIQCKALTFTVSSISCNPKLQFRSSISVRSWKPPLPSFRSSVSGAKSVAFNKFIRNCSSPNQELVVEGGSGNGSISPATEEVIELAGGDTNDGSIAPVELEVEEVTKEGDLANQSILGQMKEIVMFTGPAAGLWLCGPLMSLIDTAVIGQGSSLELAALDAVAFFPLLCSRNSNPNFITDETGPATVVCDYLCYTFMFLSVATSNLVATSLARRDKDEVQHQISILLFIGLACGVMMLVFTRLFGSWALTGAKNAEIVPAANTYVQVVAAYMMMDALNKKGYSAFSLCVPSPSELLTIFGLAAPVFITMMSKVLFYTLLVYFATSMGTSVIAAHQARMLLKSLVIIGATLGIVVGTIGTAIPWLFPAIFTHDKVVTSQMHTVIIPYFLALSITPSTHSLEGTLLAGRDLRYISLSMTGCFAVAGLVLMLLSNGGFGLRGCWYALVGFQWSRFSLALVRLLSRDGVLFSEDTSRYAVEKVKAA